ncbi:ThuA domain-containing protein [Shewanella sp. 10N.286.48.A6]|uniref:ThuA domain-containing protein n=1 Tax=Shewanella sp. 10N.286.48.A6 TaxID=1880833 RepID=UPI000C8683E2|nr:ThuA domain-containing protein [Shewanella sp. 10N.286.48.A6]PMI02143.1 Crp/Fnr family transcriptional regulator [Shewanella sp. 10N.286.48.A6]
MVLSRYFLLIIGFSLMLLNNHTLSAKQFNVLLFTKTAGWHHQSILEGVNAMKVLAEKHHFDYEWHEDANQFNDKNLARFDVIIFLNTTGDILNLAQQQAMKSFIQAGKGFVGIHSASDTEYQWTWYTQLVGRMFVIHPAIQTAKINVIATEFPGVELMPENFFWTDEYYQFSEPYSDKLKYILSVDETSYQANAQWGELKVNGMGEFHPLSWYQEFEGGRSFYTALGHLSATYQDPMFLQHLYGGIYWAATGNGL